jgi:hypothetical protein
LEQNPMTNRIRNENTVIASFLFLKLYALSAM